MELRFGLTADAARPYAAARLIGRGSAGAETKALPCWVRKAVLTLPIAAEIAALAALAGIASVPILLIVTGVANCVWCSSGDVVRERSLGERGGRSQQQAGKTSTGEQTRVAD